MHLTTQVIRLLLTMVPDQRNASLHEDSVPYVYSHETKTISAGHELSDLLNHALLPDFTYHASRITSPDENKQP